MLQSLQSLSHVWLFVTHGLQQARPRCPSPTPELAQTHVHWVSDAIQPSHPLSSSSPPAFNLSQHQGLFQWVNGLWVMPSSHLILCWPISSSVFPFSSCPQFLPASLCFPMTQLFAWGNQSTGVSALASVLPMRCCFNALCVVEENVFAIKFVSLYFACVLSCFSRVQLFLLLWLKCTRILCRWDSPGKNTRVGCHFLFQGIFLIQGSNLHLLSPALADRLFTPRARGNDNYLDVFRIT